MKPSLPLLSILVGSLCAVNAQAADSYGPYPITLKNYQGDKTNSVAYTGQMARQVLLTSLKKLSAQGNGEANPALKAKMMSYYTGKDAGRAIISPVTKGSFKIKQTTIDSLSKKKNLKGKTYKGVINGFPGQMTGIELSEFLIDKASSSNKGFDPLTGYDYQQLLAKFLAGAVFYNQAVDNYLDEKLDANNKPNNKPYKKGAYYTGKEHSWDEGFGYFGAPAHTLSLSPYEIVAIKKQKDIDSADANHDGVVDLYTEMVYAPAYYAATFDKDGETTYTHTIFQAFVDGRELIRDAKGNALTDSERAKLKNYAQIIGTNWELVIAEAAFKYAGSTYKDLAKLQTIIENNGSANKAFRAYAKHWGELKGFLMALQTSGKSLGAVSVRLNRLVGFGPVLLGGNQVTGIDADGNFETGGNQSLGDYQVHMLKVQQVLADNFAIKAKHNDVTAHMSGLLKSLGKSKSAEND